MAITSLEQETQLLLKAVSDYRTEFVKTAYLGKLAPYNHIQTQDSIPFIWSIYHDMLKEQAQTLANEINHFCISLTQLNAWDKILGQYAIEEKHILLMEFVENIAIVCVNYPSVIRSRFIFSVSHLSHQANRIINSSWKEKELPADRQINWNTMKYVSTTWSKFASLVLELENLANTAYSQATRQFRDKYHHRYPPRFELGHTGFISRIVETDGRVGYGFGGIEPLRLADLIPLLIEQHQISFVCFERYTDLVREQLGKIYETVP